MKSCLTLLCVFVLMKTNGQDINLANRYVTPGILNPALAGIANRPILGGSDNFSYNFTPVLYPEYLQKYSNSFTTGFEINPSKPCGLGLYVQHGYYHGLLKSSNVFLSSSYHKTIGKHFCIRTGLRLGFSNSKLNTFDSSYLQFKWPYYCNRATVGIGIFATYKNMYLQLTDTRIGETIFNNNMLWILSPSNYTFTIQGPNFYAGLGGFLNLSKSKKQILHLSMSLNATNKYLLYSNVNVELLKGSWLFGIGTIVIGGFGATNARILKVGYTKGNQRVSLFVASPGWYSYQFGLSFCYRFNKPTYRSNDAFEEKFNKLF